jgi:hypothetical protein
MERFLTKDISCFILADLDLSTGKKMYNYFLNCECSRQSDRPLGSGISHTQGRCLHKSSADVDTHHYPQSVPDWAKIFHALGRAATVNEVKR